VAAAEVAAAHRRVGEIYGRARAGLDGAVLARVEAWRERGRWTPGCGRALRVGVLSPDLRSHSVAFFIEPFFEGHDRAQIELVAFSNAREGDGVTARLRRHVREWHETADLTDLGVAELVASRGIDLLLDLAGLTVGNRIPCLSLKPAPVLATYCGYPDTTGLSTVDYRIVDSWTDPVAPAYDARATERLWRLDPCFLCYKPVPNPPAPRRENAGTAQMTFGCFNASRKISEPAARSWGRIMSRVPGSRLLLKSFDLADKDAAARLGAMLEAAGIEPGRVEILPATKGLAEHLEMYARVDVALDPFPYNGTTTTCEALLMGVPTVCMEGDRHASRVGVSLMHAAATPELVAPTLEAYEHLAAELVQDGARLDAYRASLRARLLEGALCDAPAFVARFQNALVQMAQGAPRG
jgi:predicted O-linked N-acetylglucosamine transferase (SPINDLY family)